MKVDERIEQLENKLGQAYQIIGVLLAGPDGNSPAFDTEAGQHILTYFSGEEDDDTILPWRHPLSKT